MIEDSKMLDIRTELEKHMDGIAQDLKDHLEHEDIVDYLEDNAIDVQLYVDLPSKEPVGFDIGIVIGEPNIYLIYSRGACKLQGAWGSTTSEKDVDSEICETILDYLTQA